MSESGRPSGQYRGGQEKEAGVKGEEGERVTIDRTEKKDDSNNHRVEGLSSDIWALGLSEAFWTTPQPVLTDSVSFGIFSRDFR